jgi:LCP family protein required for cell wall assembly
MDMDNKSKKKYFIIPGIIITVVILIGFLYFILFYSNLAKFSSESKFNNFVTSIIGKQPGCSNKNMNVLLIGIDYRGGDYLYGLADVIRFAQVDFSDQSISMIAIPRDLIVEIPTELFKVPGPYKVNQAYFFGTPGMENYYGEGNGADALNEVLEYNFGISAEYYLVFNFQAFVAFVDAIGGVDVNLPEPVYGGSQGDFPQGEQTLIGERALALARIRENYSDEFRVRNQSLIIQAIFEKMLKPANLLKIPGLVGQFQDSTLTNLPLGQVSNLALCFQGFERESLVTHQIPSELLTLENLYLTSLNEYTYGFRWDSRLVDWINERLNQTN